MSLWAKYKGNILHAGLRMNGILIWGEDKHLLDLGFKEDRSTEPVTYDKIVQKTELEELYKERKYGIWNGMEFKLTGETEKYYTIWYATGDFQGNAAMIHKVESWGMEMVEPGLWNITIPKTAITNYRIEREDLLHE